MKTELNIEAIIDGILTEAREDIIENIRVDGKESAMIHLGSTIVGDLCQGEAAIMQWFDAFVEEDASLKDKVDESSDIYDYQYIVAKEIKAIVNEKFLAEFREFKPRPESLKVVQTDPQWYPEACDKCCSFEGYLLDYPEIKVDVIVGWKEPELWKPIFKKFKNSKPGSIYEVQNSEWRPFDIPTGENKNNTLLMNTDEVRFISHKEIN